MDPNNRDNKFKVAQVLRKNDKIKSIISGF